MGLTGESPNDNDAVYTRIQRSVHSRVFIGDNLGKARMKAMACTLGSDEVCMPEYYLGPSGWGAFVNYAVYTWALRSVHARVHRSLVPSARDELPVAPASCTQPRVGPLGCGSSRGDE